MLSIREDVPGDIQALAKRVMLRCDELATCTEEPGRITRRFLTDAMRAAHVRLGGWMQDAGLSTRLDDAGNLIGHLPSAMNKQVLLMGSHLDSVPGGGKYDGVLGILIGLAVMESLRCDSLPIRVDLIAFSEEEGVRYGKPYLGSSAIADCFDSAWLRRTDGDGVALEEAIRSFGADPGQLANAAYDARQVIAFVEPHLEQGPILECADAPVGLVSGIVGQSRLRLEMVGESGHAGTTPMEGRHDALLAASRFVACVREKANDIAGLRATVGKLQVFPNAPNVIPERVELSLDVRHPRDTQRNDAVALLLRVGERLAKGEGCRFNVLEHTAQGAVEVDRQMSDHLAHSIEQCGHRPLRLVSGAGHDAVIMANRFPMAMLFVRHPGGVSHHPDERAEQADVAVAIQVLRDFVIRVANQFPSPSAAEPQL